MHEPRTGRVTKETRKRVGRACAALSREHTSRGADPGVWSGEGGAAPMYFRCFGCGVRGRGEGETTQCQI